MNSFMFSHDHCMCDADDTILAKVRMLEEEILIETLKPFNG
jgi:hypothetical protein